MPPTGTGTPQDAVRRTIQVVMIATMLALLPVIAHNLWHGNVRPAAASSVAAALMFSMVLLNRAGRYRLATDVALWGLMVCIVFMVATSPLGVHSTGMAAMPALLVVAAMMTGTRRFVIFAATVTGVSCLLAALEAAGLVARRGITSHIGTIVDFGTIFVVTALASGLLARNWKAAVESSQQDSRRLAERNLLIQQQSQALEAQKAEIENLLHKSEEASRLKSQFLANMSHEVRTPMNAIIGMAQLSLAEDPSPAHRDYLNTIVQSGEGLMVIMNDILDLSKIEAGHLTVLSEPFEIRRGIESCFRLLRLQAEQKGLQFGFTIEEEVPVSFVGDLGRVRQILVNLLGNAVKFTERGRVWLKVSGAQESEFWWRLRFEVTDEGPGIPADQLEKIFDPFRQLDGSARRKQGGTGLGLTISAKIAERMGGRIRVESEPGRGSIFTFEVPFALAIGSAQCREPGRSFLKRGRMLRILVAKDNVVNQTLARKMIEKLGHAVEVAPDGTQALERATQEDFDLVLMDVQMPNMDGYETARAIRAAGLVNVPIVAMTAHAMAGDREHCLEAGMTDYISKPITFESLATAIDRACPHHGPEPTSGEVPSSTQTSAHS